MKLNFIPRSARPRLGEKRLQIQRMDIVSALKDCNFHWVNVFFDPEDAIMSDMALLKRIQSDLEAHLAVVSDTCLMASRPLCISIAIYISQFADPLDVENKIFRDAVAVVQQWMRNVPTQGMPFLRDSLFQRPSFPNQKILNQELSWESDSELSLDSDSELSWDSNSELSWDSDPELSWDSDSERVSCHVFVANTLVSIQELASNGIPWVLFLCHKLIILCFLFALIFALSHLLDFCGS